MAWFVGTDTDNKYTVGQTYVSAGRTYTAQSDGSFRTTNSDGTVRSTAGSSAMLQESVRSAVSQSPSQRVNNPQRQVASGLTLLPNGTVQVGNGPGNGSSRGGSVTAGPGNSVAYAGSGSLRMAQLPIKDPKGASSVVTGGIRVEADPGWSDGGEFEQRYGEFAGAILGLGVLMADGWLTAKAAVGFNQPKLEKDVASGVADFARYLGERRTEIEEARRQEQLIDDYLATPIWQGQTEVGNGVFSFVPPDGYERLEAPKPLSYNARGR